MSRLTIVEGNSNDKDNVRTFMVKGEKGEQGDLNHNDIVDNLESEATNRVLSANQGRVLKNLIDNNIENISIEFITNINNESNIRNNADNMLQNQINGLASGSPKPVSSISQMTDTSKIYLLTTDGYWYYYNGTNWVQGGNYQAAEDSDSVQKLTEYLERENINIYNESYVNNGFIANNGINSSDGTYKYAKIPVEVGSTYYLYRKSNYFSTTGDYTAFYKEDGTIETQVLGQRVIQNGDINFCKIEIPNDVEYLGINVKLHQFDDVKTTILSLYNATTSIHGYDIVLRNYLTSNKSKFTNNLYNNMYTIRSNYIKEDGINYDSESIIAKIPIEQNTKYYLYRESELYTRGHDSIGFYNSNSELLNTVLLSSLTEIQSLEGKTFVEFTTPQNASFVVFNVKLSIWYNDLSKIILSKYLSSYELYGSDIALREKVAQIKDITPALENRLNNKSWLTLGDSITALTFRSTINYHDYISERTGITVTNEGISGIGYVNKYDVNKNICDLIDELTGEEDYDYITIFAGTNDRNFTLGDMNSTDKTTIYGAIKYCVTELINKFPNKKIGLLTPLPRSSNYGTDENDKLYQITKAIIEIGNYYSIPVLNQYINSGLRPWNETNNETYFSCPQAPNGDGLHPNELGHLWISYPIQHFLELL